MNDNFEKLIEDAERELRDLKTAYRQPGLVKCYSWSIEAPPSRRFRIFYDAGEQPIISEFYSGLVVMPYKPNEEARTQYAQLSGQSIYPLTIVSTRPILRVEFEFE